VEQELRDTVRLSTADIDPTVKSWTDSIHRKIWCGGNIITSFSSGRQLDQSDAVRCLDGSYAYVLDRGHIIRDGHGKAVRMIGGTTNLTGRRGGECLAREQ
jgi:hypothetical protein